jgi:acyl-coenzyme A thioesterase PaaI-like protein
VRRITNPFQRTRNDGCFACGARNPAGLHMEFYEDGDAVVCTWEPRPEFAGYGGILHGGIQATLMDEIAAWSVFVKLDTGGVTQRMEVNYRKPLQTAKGPITVRAGLPQSDGRVAAVPVELLDAEGTVCTNGEVFYRIFPEHLARAKLGYPGREAFFEA